MKVIKRDKSIQDFNPRKIRTSISRASDDINKPLNDGDTDVIVKAVEYMLKKFNKEEFTSDEIFHTTIGELANMGFFDIAKSYKNGR